MHILHSAAIVAISAAFSLTGAPNDYNAIHSQRDEIYANGTHRPNIEMKFGPRSNNSDRQDWGPHPEGLEFGGTP